MKLPRFGVEDWLNKHEKNARYDIAGVSIDALTVEDLLDLAGQEPLAFFQQFSKQKLDYGWIEGSPDFKEQVAQLYETVAPCQVLQTNGATGANILALYALIEPGDHVISLYPSYQQLYDIPRSLGADVDLWQIKEENDWLPDLEDLKQLLKSNTKMICINNANNPTGALMDRAYLEDLVSLAQSVGAYILSDEVYKSFATDQDVPAIIDLYDKGISINSLSKAYSLPGLRVGWLVAKEELAQRLAQYRDYTMISAGVLDDALASLALKHKTAIFKRNQDIVTSNLTILQNWLEKEARASAILPAQVSTSFVKLDIPIPIEDFASQLLAGYGVLVVPGNRFDIEGHVRIGYCQNQATLKQGLAKLSQALRQFD